LGLHRVVGFVRMVDGVVLGVGVVQFVVPRITRAFVRGLGAGVGLAVRLKLEVVERKAFGQLGLAHRALPFTGRP
jgi:hypothetical protein